jgi:hypothetical protein
VQDGANGGAGLGPGQLDGAGIQQQQHHLVWVCRDAIHGGTRPLGRRLLTRRARNASGTATQYTRRNDSPPPPLPALPPAAAGRAAAYAWPGGGACTPARGALPDRCLAACMVSRDPADPALPASICARRWGGQSAERSQRGQHGSSGGGTGRHCLQRAVPLADEHLLRRVRAQPEHILRDGPPQPQRLQHVGILLVVVVCQPGARCALRHRLTDRE